MRTSPMILSTASVAGTALMAWTTLGCGSTSEATHVFVHDPHQVWVEAASSSGEQVVLPAGAAHGGVRFRDGASGVAPATPYATLFREPSGGITVDDILCAPWPTNPLSASGELKVVKHHGGAPFVSDGNTVRIPYLCEGRDHTTVELDFVTPWANVREVRIVTGEVEPIAQGSSHPALQHRDWEPLPAD